MKTIKVVAAIIINSNKIFATQRGYGEFKDKWEFPGGKIEEGETPKEALIREIKEELDIKISVNEKFDTVEYDYPEFHLSMDCFICNILEGKLILKEHKDAKWLTKEELNSIDWLPADKGLVEKIIREYSNIIKIKEELVNYIENNILPLYDRNEEGHGREHIKTVTRKSIELAKKYNVNLNIAYVVASYHDIGHYIDRKKHEIISAKIFMEDENIKKWFTKDEINIIKEAIEDHRASIDHEPRSIYGKIVSTADRTIVSIEDTIKRAYSYGKKNYPNLSYEEQIERIYNHLYERYGKDGYAKIYLEDEEYDKSVEELKKALSNKVEFIKRAKKAVN